MLRSIANLAHCLYLPYVGAGLSLAQPFPFLITYKELFTSVAAMGRTYYSSFTLNDLWPLASYLS